MSERYPIANETVLKFFYGLYNKDDESLVCEYAETSF